MLAQVAERGNQPGGETSTTYFIATIKAHGFKLYDFAEEIGLTGAALSNRLHGRTD